MKETIMAYQMTTLLQKCEKEDVQAIIEIIDSYINFTDDKGLKKAFSRWYSGKMPIELNQKLETEIRYLGSSDIAYARRKLWRYVPAGVDAAEILDDIAKSQKIKLSPISSLEAKIEELTTKICGKKFDSLSPEQQRELLRKFGAGEGEIDMFIRELKKNKELLVPLLVQAIGKQAAAELISGLALSLLSKLVGQKVAEKILTEIGKRIPAQMLGPIMWVASTSWLAITLSGPANRKTMPIMLMLGVIALRDGFEKE
jgi:uncharacterized protein YaaW (UPF0174 family)